MCIAILIRQNAVSNPFRDIAVGALQATKGDALTLCSGFFQELYRGNQYCASQEYNFVTTLSMNNIALTTIGIHNNFWMPSYREFVKSLIRAGVNIRPLYKRGLRWHAKVYILKRDSIPILGIIGSSNITRPAFSTTNPFNYETDVILWNDNDFKACTFMEKQLEDVENTNELIYARYDPTLNRGLTIPQRLGQLEEELFKEKYRILET